MRAMTPTANGQPAAPRRQRRRLRPLLVSARQLARLLSVSLRTVRTMQARGELPAPVRLGRLVRWRMADVRAWIADM